MWLRGGGITFVRGCGAAKSMGPPWFPGLAALAGSTGGGGEDDAAAAAAAEAGEELGDESAPPDADGVLVSVLVADAGDPLSCLCCILRRASSCCRSLAAKSLACPSDTKSSLRAPAKVNINSEGAKGGGAAVGMARRQG